MYAAANILSIIAAWLLLTHNLCPVAAPLLDSLVPSTLVRYKVPAKSPSGLSEATKDRQEGAIFTNRRCWVGWLPTH